MLVLFLSWIFSHSDSLPVICFVLPKEAPLHLVTQIIFLEMCLSRVIGCIALRVSEHID